MTEITGKCYYCDKKVVLGIDGVWDGEECCYECFVEFFIRDKEEEHHESLY